MDDLIQIRAELDGQGVEYEECFCDRVHLGSLNVNMMDFFPRLAGWEHFSTEMYLCVVEAGFEIVLGNGWVTCD